MKAAGLPSGDAVVATAEGYDRWADVYETDGNPLTLLEAPQVERLLGDVNNKTLLDVGCGTGRHALRYANAGARVTAIDFSSGMLAKAREKAGAERIQFLEHDLAKPLPFDESSFDRVLCSLVIEHIADLELLFAEMYRVCDPAGTIVVTAMHPAMMMCGVQAGFRDPVSGEKVYPRSYPNQLSDFVMAALSAKLQLLELREYPVDETLTAAAPRAEKYLGWLMLLTMQLRRIGS
jgi:ubiquinone/menaquinone biosynthesis C-methylase UbiE